MKAELLRAAVAAAEQTSGMARQLEHLTTDEMGWLGPSPQELVASEFRCWLSEEMNEGLRRAR